jgi:hypothetical protein
MVGAKRGERNKYGSKFIVARCCDDSWASWLAENTELHTSFTEAALGQNHALVVLPQIQAEAATETCHDARFILGYWFNSLRLG